MGFPTTPLHGMFSRSQTRRNKKAQANFEERVRGAGSNLDQKLEAGESFGTAFLKDSLARGREFEAQGEGLRTRHLAGVNNLGQEQTRLGAAAGAGAQQKFQTPGGASFAKNLEQSVRRGKARQGVINRGDAAIRNQQLKDRLTAARGDISRRGTLQQTAADAARLRSGVDVAQRNANAQIGASRTGALGAVAGGLARGFKDGFSQDNGAQVSVDMDQGTAAADFNINNSGDFDINNIGGSGGTAFV
jgi:hypothetical protein